MKRAITLKPPKNTSAKLVDQDNPPWSENMLGPPVKRRGRGQQKAPTKVLTVIRLDADVIAFSGRSVLVTNRASTTPFVV